MKWLKLLVGILLLPLCGGGAWALVQVVRATGQADTVWVALGAGAACWLAVYLLMPKPMWVYVFGHELTHVLWTWLMGGRVKKFRASAKGGHVVVTKNNFLIALAPYFFPIYAFLAAGVFEAGQWMWNWRPYVVWFHLCLGAAYAFHLTLTWHILKESQTDITEQGYLFSAVVICLGNLAVLLIGIPLLTAKIDVTTALRWWGQCSLGLILRLTRLRGGG
jgi:Peptidase M50B-like